METSLSYQLQAVCTIPPSVRGISRALRFSGLQTLIAKLKKEQAVKRKLDVDQEYVSACFVKAEEVRTLVTDLLDFKSVTRVRTSSSACPYCLNVHRGIKRKLNVLEAILFSIDSWSDVSADCIRNCWVMARIANAELLGELRHAGEYAVATEQNTIDDLASMLEGISTHDNVFEYLEIDADVDVHELPGEYCDRNAADDADSDNEDDEHEQPPVSALTALAYCIELSSFLFQCEGDTKREQEILQSLTMLARAQVVKRRRQTSLGSFMTPM